MSCINCIVNKVKFLLKTGNEEQALVAYNELKEVFIDKIKKSDKSEEKKKEIIALIENHNGVWDIVGLKIYI